MKPVKHIRQTGPVLKQNKKAKRVRKGMGLLHALSLFVVRIK